MLHKTKSTEAPKNPTVVAVDPTTPFLSWEEAALHGRPPSLCQDLIWAHSLPWFLLVSSTLKLLLLTCLNNSYTFLNSHELPNFWMLHGNVITIVILSPYFHLTLNQTPHRADVHTVFASFREMLNQYLPYLLSICGWLTALMACIFHPSLCPCPLHMALHSLLLREWGLFLPRIRRQCWGAIFKEIALLGDLAAAEFARLEWIRKEPPLWFWVVHLFEARPQLAAWTWGIRPPWIGSQQ